MAGANQIDVTIRLIDQASKQMKDVGKETGKLKKVMGQLGKVVGAIGFAALAKEAAKFTLESAKLAARVETLGVVTQTLGRNAGYSTTEILKLERSIQKQGITTQASRQALAKMMQAQLDLADATDLARLAQDAAVIAGTNSSEAFERLVNVISTGNVRMARTMGLQVDFNAGYEKMAEKLGITADALTAEQKAQARANAVIQEGTQIAGAYAEAMESVGKQLTSTPRYFEEFKVAFGENFIDVLGAGNLAVQDWLSGTTATLNALHLTKEAEEEGLITAWESFKVRSLVTNQMQDANEVIKTMTGLMDDKRLAEEEAVKAEGDHWLMLAAANQGVEDLNESLEANVVITEDMTETQALAAVAQAIMSGATDLQVEQLWAQYNAIKSGNDELERYIGLLKTGGLAGAGVGISDDPIQTGITLDGMSLDDLGKLTGAGTIKHGGLTYQDAQWVGGSLIVRGQDTGIKKEKGGRHTGISLVGEAGPEYIIGNTVIPARQTRQMMNAGIRPSRQFYSGGLIGVDGMTLTELEAAKSAYVASQDSTTTTSTTSPTTAAVTSATQAASTTVGKVVASTITSQSALEMKASMAVQNEIVATLKQLPTREDMQSIMKSALEQVIL